MASEPAGAVQAAVLLVGHGEEDDVALERHPPALEVDHRGELGDAEALVVDRAAPPEQAALDQAGERRHGPPRARGDDVHVVEQEDRPAAAASATTAGRIRLARPSGSATTRDAIPARWSMPARKAAASASLPGGFEVSIRRYCWSHPAASDSVGEPGGGAGERQEQERGAGEGEERAGRDQAPWQASAKKRGEKQIGGLRLETPVGRELESLWVCVGL